MLNKIEASIASHPLIIMVRKKKLPPCYLVGGYYPALYFGEKVGDLDLITDDISKFRLALEKAFYRKFKIITDRKGHKVLKFKIKEVNFDISEMERNIEADAARRDFRFNSIYYDITNKRIIDPLGGIEEIKSTRISLSSKDSLIKDPVRIIRYYRFLDKYGLTPSSSTQKKAAEFDPCLLDNIAVERMILEVRSIFLQVDSWKTISVLLEKGILHKIFPFVDELEEVSQNQFHSFDVITHSLFCLKWIDHYRGKYPLEDIFSLKMAALFHDIGKKQAAKEDAGEVCFHGHEKIGGDLMKKELPKLKLSKKEIRTIKFLVEKHMYPAFLKFSENVGAKALRRYVRRSKEHFWALLVLFLADGAAAHDKTDTEQETFAKKLAAMFKKIKEEEMSIIPVSGDDLIALGYDEGPVLGKILKDIKNGFEERRFKNREEAIRYAKKSLENSK